MSVKLPLERVVSQEPSRISSKTEWRLDWVDDQGSLTPAARKPKSNLLSPDGPFFPTPGGSSAPGRPSRGPSKNAISNFATHGLISTAGEQATSRTPPQRRIDGSGYGTGVGGLDDSGYPGRGPSGIMDASGYPSRGPSGALKSPRPGADKEPVSLRIPSGEGPRPSKRRELVQRITGQEPTGLPPEGSDPNEPPPKCVVM